MNILDYLPVGEPNAIPTRELVRISGFKNARELQQHIELLRNNGTVICSTCKHGGGYFIHDNIYELRSFIHTVENRAHHSLRSLESAKYELATLERSV